MYISKKKKKFLHIRLALIFCNPYLLTKLHGLQLPISRSHTKMHMENKKLHMKRKHFVFFSCRKHKNTPCKKKKRREKQQKKRFPNKVYTFFPSPRSFRFLALHMIICASYDFDFFAQKKKSYEDFYFIIKIFM